MNSGSDPERQSAWNKVVGYFRPGQFAKSVGLLAGGTALAQLIRLAAEPVLTRIFSREDYGVYNAYLAVMSFAAVAACLRLELAIFLPEDDEEAAAVTTVAIIASFTTGLLTAIVAAILVETGVLQGEYAALTSYAWVFPISVIGYGLFLSLSYWLSRKKRFKCVALGKFGQTGGQAAAQLTAGMINPVPFGLIIGDAIGRLLGSALMFREVFKQDWGAFRSVSRRQIKSSAVRYRNFMLVSAPSALINTAAFSVPMLMIGWYYGAATLGLFGLVYRVMSLPASFTTQSISQVYMSEAGQFLKTEPKSLRSLYKRTLTKMLVIGFVPHAVVAIFGPTLFGLVFGAEWAEAGEYARILALMHFLSFAIGPLQTTLNLLERQWAQFALDVSRTVLCISTVYVCWRFSLEPKQTIGAFSAALSIALLGNVVLTYASISAVVKQSNPHAVA